MNNGQKMKYKPYDPCKPQLFKTEKYRYYRYPVKYVCIPVEWDTKCEKIVCWEPVKPYPPVKVPCEQLKQFHCSPDQQYDNGYAQDGAYYEEGGYMQDGSDGFDGREFEDGGDAQ